MLDLVRGLSVDDAERTLQLCEKDAADDVLKVLESAIANAEHNNHLPAEELFVAVAFADEGPTRKWGQPRARGRYFRIRKRTSHITVIVARYDDDELERRRRDRGVVGTRRRGRAAAPGRARAPVASPAGRRARPRPRPRPRRRARVSTKTRRRWPGRSRRRPKANTSMSTKPLDEAEDGRSDE